MPKAGAILATEHQMVDDRAVERLGGASEAAGGPAVAVAGGRIAARMIVGEDDPGAAVERGVGDDPAEREIGAALVAGMTRDVETVRGIIEMGDPQAFERRIGIGHAAGEEGSGGGEAVELQREFGTLISHGEGVPEAGDGNDLNRIPFGQVFPPFWGYICEVEEPYRLKLS